MPLGISGEALFINVDAVYRWANSNSLSEVKEMYQDKTLICKECGAEFVFTAGEQEFYAEKGFVNEPQRCKACRDARKNNARPEKRNVHRCLRWMRQRGKGSFQTQRGQTCILQRVLCENERRKLITLFHLLQMIKPP